MLICIDRMNKGNHSLQKTKVVLKVGLQLINTTFDQPIITGFNTLDFVLDLD
ncbi:MAG: hypothetical protein RIQ89_1443 [Bacteroidota bacterium]|jgi:hypothetical protein